MLEDAIATKSAREEMRAEAAEKSPSAMSELWSRFFNVGLALVFLPYALIIMGIFWALMKIANRDNGPFLYKGERLGKHKRPYPLYKIRTLAMGAEEKIGDELYRPGGRLELRFGTFLRKSRLDELPQLFNIIKGDMDFIGPRPLRRVVYEKNRAIIPGYEERFAVRPGLTGFSQFFTPHKTPKRIRSLIDNHYIRKKGGLLFETLFIIRTGWAVLRNTLVEAGHAACDAVSRLARGLPLRERRRMRRLRARLASVALFDDAGGLIQGVVRLVDINHEALAVETQASLEPGQAVRLRLTAPKKNGRPKTARLTGVARPAPGSPRADGAGGPPRRYVIDYEPASELQRYVVDQYVLKDSIA